MQKKVTDLMDLYTEWGKQTKVEKVPLNDYPRPQLVRENWQNLNGYWHYEITESGEKPAQFSQQILVPFSPEALLSGVQKMVKPTDILWYQRLFPLTHQLGRRTILHFGAVDQICEVWVNDHFIGEHEGGYWPFSFDISEVAKETNEVIVKVVDLSDESIHSYGKQKQDHGEIWYTPQSGIWQTVWLEQVPLNYVTNLTLVPEFDEGRIKLEIEVLHRFETGSLVIKSKGTVIHEGAITDLTTTVALPNFIPWSPSNPHLYDVELIIGEDQVKSYFGMRKFSVGENSHGHQIPLLNNNPIFYNGLLDQGYWSDGLYTPPSDQAMIEEITLMKELGFNMLRKHIKIEPLRWYYHCDRLGMLVWQDFVNGGSANYNHLIIKYLPFVNVHLKDHNYSWFNRKALTGREQFEKEVVKTVDLLKNVTSLAVWVPFNEGWGQFDSTRIGNLVRNLDPTRLIDYVSGYHDQGQGDFKSPHIYYKKYRFRPDKYKRVHVLSEFGGYSCPTEGHMASSTLFGYKIFPDKRKFTDAYVELYEREILPAIGKGLAGTVYTQVSDVQDEINGLVTYDRKILKVDYERVRDLNKRIYQTFNLLNDAQV